MAFTLRNLSVLAYANGFTLWHYKAGAEPISSVCAKGYLADAADLLKAGDMVMVSSDNGGKIGTILGEGKNIEIAPLFP